VKMRPEARNWKEGMPTVHFGGRWRRDAAVRGFLGSVAEQADLLFGFGAKKPGKGEKNERRSHGRGLNGDALGA